MAGCQKTRSSEKIKEKQDFFQGAQLVFDVGNTVLGADELGQVRDMLDQPMVSFCMALSVNHW
jgi:hypothetical protein